MKNFFKRAGIGIFALTCMVVGAALHWQLDLPALAQSLPSGIVTVSNTATLNAHNYIGSPYVQLRGYYTDADGGGGGILIYKASDTTTANNGVTVFVDSAGHRYYRAKGIPISVLEGGAKCDNSTDDTTRIQATFQYASSWNSTNAVVTFPLTQCKTTNGILAYSNFTIKGPGKGIGGIVENDAAATHGAAIYGNDLSNVLIDGLRITGSWAANNSDSGDRCTAFVRGFNITHQNSECYSNRGIGFSVNIGSVIWFKNNFLHSNARDNISCEDCQSGGAVDNIIIHGGDDAIAWHVSPSAGAPVRGNVTIANNKAQDAFGYKALGLKAGSVTGNTCHLCKGYGLYVTYDTGFNEGDTSLTSVDISSNVITDIVNPFIYDGSNNINSCLVLGSAGQGGSGASIPFYSTGAAIQQPWNYTWNAGPTSAAISPGFAQNIHDNTCTRTLPDAVAYTSYAQNPTKEPSPNANKMFTAAGWIDPTVSAGSLNGTGAFIRGYMYHSNLSNNIFATGTYGVFFAANGQQQLFINGLVMRGNTIFNVTGDGIGQDLTAPGLAMNMIIENNYINCDPLGVSTAHHTDGTWDNTAFPGAIDLVRVKGATVGGNHIANCAFGLRTDVDSSIAVSSPNILYLNPAALGYNAGNAGIGNVRAGEHYVVGNWDMRSVNFGVIANDNYTSADLSGGCPSTGTWVKGVFITNTSTAISAGKVLLACTRLTTGSANVANTDWAAIYGTNS